ncbi:MAG: ATP-grasp domain-containing protein [Candidatus Nitronauta litoralis]|uniref:ATP-grasp domain-containing protein n=1 Tax=Candidatus Nitronauta litoralis TaxID=2705533 RepID=A0A7T0FZH1_9BACT|nr:MAG: ATP-grasp domain-containing protein [Candidatus Nitronauta litoralis]
MNEINILFLAPHWRVTLMRAFQDSWSKRQLPGRLLGADSDEQAGALQVLTESFTLPEFSDSTCLDELRDLCKREAVSVIFPLTNKAVDFLDTNRKVLGDYISYMPPAETVAVCHDKFEMAERFQEASLNVPPTFLADALPDDIPFPLITKPRHGEGSQNVHRVESAEDLEYFRQKFPQHVFQKFIEGTEFSIDWFANRKGIPRLISPRERLTVRGGEVMKSRIVLLPKIIEVARALGDTLSLTGPATLQGILDDEGRFWLTDINLRFGSGYVHSILAGADIPALIHGELSGVPDSAGEYSVRDGSIMVRYPGHLIL